MHHFARIAYLAFTACAVHGFQPSRSFWKPSLRKDTSLHRQPTARNYSEDNTDSTVSNLFQSPRKEMLSKVYTDLMLKQRESQSEAPTPSAGTQPTSLLETPQDAFQILANKGKANAEASAIKTFVSAFLGGSYVGMGGMLSLAVAGQMGGVAASNPGMTKLVFAILFPVNLLLCLQAGGQLFTGNTAYMSAALCEKKVQLKSLLRSWFISFWGNLLACSTFAFLCKYCGVLAGGAAEMAVKTFASKTSLAFGPLVVRAILCNWLVCLAVYLSMQARDMTGKYLSILLPISTFVAIGFEHSVANMFLLPAGLLCSDGGATLGSAIFRNLIPVSIGNALSGSLMVGATFSFMFGRLGRGKWSGWLAFCKL